jgi:hypothetical protein
MQQSAKEFDRVRIDALREKVSSLRSENAKLRRFLKDISNYIQRECKGCETGTEIISECTKVLGEQK